MNESRAQTVLAGLAEDAPGACMLWRGAGFGGSDVDLVVLDGRDHDVMRALRTAGLAPAPQADGRLVWRSFDQDALVIDTLPARGWRSFYPPLGGVIARSEPGPQGIAIASPGDRLLFLAAEAVAGYPIEKIATKASDLLAHGARPTGDTTLAELIADPDQLRRQASRGRLAYPVAARVALRSPRARAALRDRVARRLGSTPALPAPRATEGQPGVIVALSGMDGSGKSSAGLELRARLERRGRPAVVSWNRFAAESALLGLIAAPVRRILRRSGPIADPVATDGADAGDAGAAAPAAGRGPVAWVWVVVVAAINARSCRRAARMKRDGAIVVCDRWLADALVDLEVRYGRHRMAEWVLRRGVPRADVTALLQIDAGTSERRKPGDQAPSVLAAMARRYAGMPGELGQDVVVIDATTEREQVADAVDAAVTARLA